MILPNKHLPEQRSLLRVGAEILPYVTEPRTVSYLWNRLAARTTLRNRDFITYDWFLLALAFLATIELVEFANGRVRRIK